MKAKTILALFACCAARIAFAAAAADPSEVWVSDSRGDNDSGNGSYANPYKTIQKGVDEASAGGTVKIEQGVYDEGETLGGSHSNRVSITKRLILEGVDGKDVTHIVGHFDTESGDAYGRGDKAVRCVWISIDSASGTVLKNLTIRNGATRLAGASYQQSYGGGVQGMKGTTTSASISQTCLIDCVVSNCSGYAGAGINGVVALRCRLEDNICGSYGAAARMSKLVNCLVRGNRMPGTSGKRGIVCYCTAVNCTVVGSVGTYATGIASSAAYNCVSFQNGGGDLTSMESTANTYTTTTSATLLYDYANGDYRLSPGTAAVGGGLTEHLSLVSLPEGESAYFDYAGRKINQEATTCDAGCLQGAVVEDEKTITITAANGGIAVSGASLGENLLAVGDTVTFTPAAGTRPCTGVKVNGADYLFDDTPSIDITITAALASSTTISAIYTKDWYVNTAAADNSGTGFRLGDPKKTLAAVMPLVASGDTVHAAAGSYTNDTMVSNSMEGRTVKARVAVPSGVALVADDGPDVTFIIGEADTDAGNANSYGMGTNAARCVHLAKDASIKGFTITGGRTWWDTSLYTPSTSFGQVDSSYVGGGVCGNSTGYSNSYVEDCVLSNNCAYFGGGAAFTRLVNCRVFDNKATSGGGAIYKSGAYGSIINRSRAGTSGATRSAIYNFYDIVGCTLGADNRYIDGDTIVRALYVGASSSKFHHNLVLGVPDGSLNNTVTYCVFANGCANYPTNETCVVAPAAEVAVDDNLRPIVGKNPAVDAGSSDVLSTYAPKLSPYNVDVSGAQRVMNGKVDIGALEADWRPVYARLLTGSTNRLVVATVDPGVTNVAGGVSLADGESISLSWRSFADRPARRFCHVRVTGGGTLSLAVNGESFATFTAADAEPFSLPASVGLQVALSFSFVGEGCAQLFDFSAETGTVLTLQ